MRVLIAGVGNVLHGDDGFGVEVARALVSSSTGLHDGVTVTETGIGGIALVQDLMRGYDGVVILDATDRGRPPGTVMTILPEVRDVHRMAPMERHDLLADMHLATPDRALMVAEALGVLPARRVLVGCQPLEVEVLRVGLSAPVLAAIPHAVAEVHRCIAGWSAEWRAERSAERSVEADADDR